MTRLEMGDGEAKGRNNARIFAIDPVQLYGSAAS